MSPTPSPFNIIVVGVGGQGVVTLADTFWRASAGRRWPCQGAILKGGAQQHGTVLAFLRIFPDGNPDYHRYSPEIPEGDLDLIVGLEPWEVLRQARFFGPRTRILTQSRPQPFPTERFRARAENVGDPVAELGRLGRSLLAEDFAARAGAELGSVRMAGYLLAASGVDAKLIPFEQSEIAEAYASAAKLGAGDRMRLQLREQRQSVTL